MYIILIVSLFFTSINQLTLYFNPLGDQSSLSAWSPKDNTVLIVQMVLFSFLIVVYLMNLFIGLLNMSIEKDNDRASYLVHKAEILVEIELFYLLPFQRRWKHWFPEVIYYKARIDVARKHIRDARRSGKWKTDDCPEYKNKVLRQLGMLDLID